METILMIIKLLGGLAMFLYGMEIMGDGLKQGSGTVLKNVLGKLTQNVFLGLLTGTLVTAVIQSSTATIVLTVGLLSAGILNLKQAVSIVLGANIGTTVIGTDCIDYWYCSGYVCKERSNQKYWYHCYGVWYSVYRFIKYDGCCGAFGRIRKFRKCFSIL